NPPHCLNPLVPCSGVLSRMRTWVCSFGAEPLDLVFVAVGIGGLLINNVSHINSTLSIYHPAPGTRSNIPRGSGGTHDPAIRSRRPHSPGRSDDHNKKWSSHRIG